MNFKNILNLLFVVILLYSCGEDEGNYVYDILGDVEVENFSSYGFVFGDNVIINPEIITDIEEDELTYVWYIDRLIRKDTIGTEKNLNTVANFEGGVLFLAIKHTESQVEWRYKADLEIQFVYQKGWAILSNTNQGAKFNFLSGVKTGPDGVIYEYYPEVYKNANGELLPATTTDFILAHRDNLWMLRAENDGVCVNMNTMAKTKLLSNYFSTTEYLNGAFKPEYVGFSNTEGSAQLRMLSSGGDLFVASNISDGDPVSFSAPIEGEHYLGKHLVGNYGEYVAFDESNKRYLWINCNGGRIKPVVPEHASTGSDVTIDIGNLNMECIKMGNLSWDQRYAVLKDESGNFHIHVFTPEYVTLRFFRNEQLEAGIITDNSIIAHAPGYIYIGTGNSIHLYNIENNTFTYDWKVFDSEILAIHAFINIFSGSEFAVAVKNGENSKFIVMDPASIDPTESVIKEVDVEGHVLSCEKKPW